jgi:hypothetical protein
MSNKEEEREEIAAKIEKLASMMPEECAPPAPRASKLFLLRAVFGTCPVCTAAGERNPEPAIVYRRSKKSVTMKCTNYGLQWAMTWAMIHKAVSKYREHAEYGDMFAYLADDTAHTVDKRTPMERNRVHGATSVPRVIRLGWTQHDESCGRGRHEVPQLQTRRRSGP